MGTNSNKIIPNRQTRTTKANPHKRKNQTLRETIERNNRIMQLNRAITKMRNQKNPDQNQIKNEYLVFYAMGWD
jgi:hypothetical protein